MKWRVCTALLMVCLLGGATAGATLIGDSIDGFFEFSSNPGFNQWDGTNTPQTVIVGAGIEFTDQIGGVTADVDDSSIWITLNFVEGGTLGTDFLFWFEDLDWVDMPGEIVDVILTGSTFDGVLLDFGPHSVHLRIPDQTLPSDTVSLHLDIIPRHVPEPATMTLLGLGLAGFALRRRMKA